jgi:hypothetical protein
MMTVQKQKTKKHTSVDLRKIDGNLFKDDMIISFNEAKTTTEDGGGENQGMLSVVARIL